MAVNGLPPLLLWSSRANKERKGHQFDIPRDSCRLATAAQFGLYGADALEGAMGGSRAPSPRLGSTASWISRQPQQAIPATSPTSPSCVHLICRWRYLDRSATHDSSAALL